MGTSVTILGPGGTVSCTTVPRWLTGHPEHLETACSFPCCSGACPGICVLVPQWESGGWASGCLLGMEHHHKGDSQKDSSGVEVIDQGWVCSELCLCPEPLYRARQAGNLRAWVCLGQVTSETRALVDSFLLPKALDWPPLQTQHVSTSRSWFDTGVN